VTCVHQYIPPLPSANVTYSTLFHGLLSPDSSPSSPYVLPVIPLYTHGGRLSLDGSHLLITQLEQLLRMENVAVVKRFVQMTKEEYWSMSHGIREMSLHLPHLRPVPDELGRPELKEGMHGQRRLLLHRNRLYCLSARCRGTTERCRPYAAICLLRPSQGTVTAALAAQATCAFFIVA